MSRPEPSRIPSNVRIKRARSGVSTHPVQSFVPPTSTDNDRSKDTHGDLPDTPRRWGVIENLARLDRNTESSTSNVVGKANIPGLQPPFGESESSQQRLPPKRPAAVETRLPAVAEVSSPTEAAIDSRKDVFPTEETSSSSKAGPSVPSSDRDYFANATSLGSKPVNDRSEASALSPPSQTYKNERPELYSTASMPAEDVLSPSRSNKSDLLSHQNTKDDSLVPDGGGRLFRKPSNIAQPLNPDGDGESSDSSHHVAEVADYLDVVDPEVGALGYLSNIQNSIFVPNIPALYDRRPSHSLPTARKRSGTVSSFVNWRRGKSSSAVDSHSQVSRRSSRLSSQEPNVTEATDLEMGPIPKRDTSLPAFQGDLKPSRTVSRGVLSRVSSAVGWRKKEEEEYDKHIKEWRYMDEEERNELDEHIKLVLTKKSKFKRALKGFYAFVKTPMGFIMTLYGFLITFWGTAIMLFIFSWIKVGARRRYWIEICDQILCALFAAVGLGFAPFRAVDTYRMIHIAKLHHRTWERRTKLGLHGLRDPNDLPRPVKDGANQVSRIIPLEESDDSNIGLDSRMNTDQSDEQAPDSTRKHWWDVRHSNSSGHREQLINKSRTFHSQSSDNSHSKRKKGQIVLPQNCEEDPTGKTGDLRQHGETGRPLEQLKRNESIRSELVKEREDIVVLTKEEQELLEHHQRKFHASHTFYRFHETATHRAFPLDLMITIVCLLDCHSLLQGALGGCTWGIKYTHRPTALTATLITCSLSCNAMAGLLIYIGGRKTKKREEVERRLKIALEKMALEKIERRRARGELPDRHHDIHRDHSEPGSDSSANEGSTGNQRGELSPTSDEEQNEKELREAVENTVNASEHEDRQHDKEMLQQGPQVVAGAGQFLSM